MTTSRILGLFVLMFALAFAGQGSQASASPVTSRQAATLAMAADINPGPGGSVNAAETGAAVGNGIVFAANDGVHGLEPRFSNGTPAGTVLLDDIVPGSNASYPFAFTSAGAHAYFLAGQGDNSGLYQTAGTPSTTRLIAGATKLCADPSNSDCLAAIHVTSAGGRLFLLADGRGNPTGNVAVLSAGGHITILQTASGDVGIYRAMAVGSRLFFLEVGKTTQLWTTDGTASGTRLVKNFGGDIHTLMGPVAASSSTLSVFTVGNSKNSQTVIWTVNSATGKVSSHIAVTPPGEAAAAAWFDGRLYFDLDVRNKTNAGFHVFLMDAQGKLVQTVMRMRRADTLFPEQFVAAAGHLFFQGATASTGGELWMIGPWSKPELVKDIEVGHAGSSPNLLTPFGGRLYFTASDGSHGRELWSSDGTAQGTTMAGDIKPGDRGSGITWLVPGDGRLFFDANDGTHGLELWTVRTS